MILNNTVQVEETSQSETPVAPISSPDEEPKRIGAIRVIIVNNLLQNESDISETAREEPDFDERIWLKRERYISGLALANIEKNVHNLAEEPDTKILHLSEVTREAVDEYQPDAIVLSGTLSDFDFYDTSILERFGEFVRTTEIPVLGICGGHQLVGLSFGTRIVTLDGQLPSARRRNRIVEYQYRYVKILRDDPIFDRIQDRSKETKFLTRKGPRIIRVWQNHGLQIDRIPEGFINLASGYLCPIQMLVKRTDRQLIYTVQFHIEKSFEDWNRPKSFWDHSKESRDGRVIFENFLIEAMKHRDALYGTKRCLP